MRVPVLAVYLRTSLEDYGKSHHLLDQSCSIANQRKVIQDYITSHADLTALHPVEYIDDGFTGTNTERPRFQDMIHDVQAGQIGCIIVKDLSRFGRNYREVGDYLEKVLPSLGIRVIAVNDAYDSADLLGTTGGLDVAFRNFVYDSYSRDLSVKVRTAMRTRMENGGKFVNHTPYGYMKDPRDKHHMIPDPETAPIVRDIFRMVIGGASSTEVARSLNVQGIPTPAQRKGNRAVRGELEPRWSHAAIIRIIETYKYTGAMVNHTRENRHMRAKTQHRIEKEDWIITEGAHEAIVSKEEYEAANAMIHHPVKFEHRRKGTPDAVFYCGYCGRKLQRTHGTDIYFSCCQHKYQNSLPCKGLRWSRTDLENALLPVYRAQIALLGQRILLDKKQEHSEEDSIHRKRLEQIEKDIEFYNQRKMLLFERYHDGQIDVVAYVDQKGDLTAQQEKLREERGRLEVKFLREKQRNEQCASRREQLKQYLTDASLPDQDLIPLMYEAIDRVSVMESELEIRWKFEDVFRDISPQEDVLAALAGKTVDHQAHAETVGPQTAANAG